MAMGCVAAPRRTIAVFGVAPCPGHFSDSFALKWAPAALCFIQAKEIQGICPLVPPMARPGQNR